jgi:hypothetical protein
MAVAPREAMYNCTKFEFLTLVQLTERGSSGVARHLIRYPLLWYKKPPTGLYAYHLNLTLDFDAPWSC